jgi:hypothetical protein
MIGPVYGFEPSLEFGTRQPSHEHGISIRRQPPDQSSRPWSTSTAFHCVLVDILLTTIEIDHVATRSSTKECGSFCRCVLDQFIDVEVSVPGDAARGSHGVGKRFRVDPKSRMGNLDDHRTLATFWLDDLER